MNVQFSAWRKADKDLWSHVCVRVCMYIYRKHDCGCVCRVWPVSKDEWLSLSFVSRFCFSTVAILFFFNSNRMFPFFFLFKIDYFSCLTFDLLKMNGKRAVVSSSECQLVNVLALFLFVIKSKGGVNALQMYLYLLNLFFLHHIKGLLTSMLYPNYEIDQHHVKWNTKKITQLSKESVAFKEMV